MPDILERIPNPLTRSAASALMGASAATIISGGLLGFSSLESRQVNRLSVCAGAAGAVAGVIFGLGGVKPALAASRSASPQAASPGSAPNNGSDDWRDWRDFVVVRKVPESREITSFYLKPKDGKQLPDFMPGQFLTIKLEIPGQARPVIRTYSLSDYAPTSEYYRLSIKREGPPRGQDVPPGVASNFMHNHVQEGSVIPAKPPNGRFVLNVPEPHPAVLISNGVGITPMIAMAKAAVAKNPNRSIWFLHGARNGEFHAFRDVMVALEAESPNLEVIYRYSRPRPEDEGHFHSSGYVDVELVKSLLPNGHEAEYFLCGSPRFMDSLRSGLAEWGVPEERVKFESFSKPKTASKTVVTAPPAASDGASAVETAEVVFAKSGKTAIWTANDGSLLEFAEDQGLSPAFSCRAGICLTCMCAVQEGEVAYDEPPTGTPDEGSALICVGQPGSRRVVLDL